MSYDTKEVSGFVLEVDYQGQIMSIQNVVGVIARLGATVKSSGKFNGGPPEGTEGVVEFINEPHTDGFTSNVIGVKFPDHPRVLRLKPKDIIME